MRTGLALFVFCLPLVSQVANRRTFRLSELKTQPGYEVTVFATIAGGPRHMTIGPNGVLYAAARGNGTIVAVPMMGQQVVALRGLNGPHTVEFREGFLYIGVNDGVVRFRNAVTEDYVVRTTAERLLTLPAGGQHSTRTIAIGSDGSIYASVGSSCNFCAEADSRRASVLRFNADGSGQTTFGKGLRNSVGLAWHPRTGELWSVDNGGDELGENEPPDEVNIVKEGADYGWPDCIGKQRPNRWGPQAKPERCDQTAAPEFEMQAHSAPLGIGFYTGGMLPVAAKNDALVALHGSWNRPQPVGYKVVRLRAATGAVTAAEDFLWGFLDTASRTTSGRPVHAITGPDGAVYVSDDATGNIYRVEYKGPRINEDGVGRVADNAFFIYGQRLVKDDPALVQVFVNGLAAEILYVDEGEVGFVMPEGLKGSVTVTLKNELASDEATITID
ncbi:MAG: PQQ-dependent sugar dehydrogenase [Candidatus Solibacter usitatus]|nr:PQQ-dependent sugar dehydrogenase [Candidatus Solibacter usitatus]